MKVLMNSNLLSPRRASLWLVGLLFASPVSWAATPAESSVARGVLRAEREAVLSSAVSERIVRMPFREGEHFDKGEALVTFDCGRLPAAQTMGEDTALTFSAANGNAISVADADNGSLTVTLDVSNGSLTLSGTSGLTFTTGDGTADPSMTFSGTAAAINAALAGLSYTPTADYNGAATLTLVTSDGTVSDSDTVAITVTPVADIANDSKTTAEDTLTNIDVNANDTYTPNKGFNGGDSFVVMVDDGHGNRVPAVVDIKVMPPAASRDDYPFVFLPEGGSGQADGRNHGARTEVGPGVLGDAVNRIDSLAALPTLHPDGVVLQAVDGVRSLGGTASLDVGGAVLTAVNGVDSLKSIDAPAEQRDDLQRTLGGSVGDGAVQSTALASLHLEDGSLALNLVARGPQVWIDVSARGDVRAIRASGVGGAALPDWVRVDSRGYISIDRPADVERLRMRLQVQRERGAGSSHLIEIDFNAGQMRLLKNGDEAAAKPARGQASAPAALDFAAQLARAAERRDPVDSELLDMLS